MTIDKSRDQRVISPSRFAGAILIRPICLDDYEITSVRAHIPVTCCARTRKISETAAISQECGDDGEKVDVLLRCDIFGPSPLPVCVKLVSHAVPSYIPVEIIHGESTPAGQSPPADERAEP